MSTQTVPGTIGQVVGSGLPSIINTNGGAAMTLLAGGVSAIYAPIPHTPIADNIKPAPDAKPNTLLALAVGGHVIVQAVNPPQAPSTPIQPIPCNYPK